MIDFKVILGILLVHWVADFILQTDYQAKNKSSSMNALVGHTGLYSAIWLAVGVIYCAFNNIQPEHATYFWLITLSSHTITDYFTSRWVKKLFSKQDYHNGFVVVGFDQILHYVQLFLTYIWLS